jgi:hypothetical protein
LIFLSSESIEQLIIERIGVDIFQEKLQMLLKSKYFVGVMPEPLSIPETPNDMILENEFTILYMDFHGSIIEWLRRSTMNSANNSFTVPTSTDPYVQQISKICKHFSDLIRERDEQINIYKHKEKQWIDERDIILRKSKI